MIKEAESLDIKEGNQILDTILSFIKLPQVNTKTHTRNNRVFQIIHDFVCSGGKLPVHKFYKNLASDI